jgi:hypothetical protein
MKVKVYSEEGYFQELPPIGEIVVRCSYVADHPIYEIKEDYLE